MVASDSVLLSLCLQVEDEGSDARSRLSALQARIPLSDSEGGIQCKGEGSKGGGGTAREREEGGCSCCGHVCNEWNPLFEHLPIICLSCFDVLRFGTTRSCPDRAERETKSTPESLPQSHPGKGASHTIRSSNVAKLSETSLLCAQPMTEVLFAPPSGCRTAMNR